MTCDMHMHMSHAHVHVHVHVLSITTQGQKPRRQPLKGKNHAEHRTTIKLTPNLPGRPTPNLPGRPTQEHPTQPPRAKPRRQPLKGKNHALAALQDLQSYYALRAFTKQHSRTFNHTMLFGHSPSTPGSSLHPPQTHAPLPRQTG